MLMEGGEGEREGGKEKGHFPSVCLRVAGITQSRTRGREKEKVLDAPPAPEQHVPSDTNMQKDKKSQYLFQADHRSTKGRLCLGFAALLILLSLSLWLSSE